MKEKNNFGKSEVLKSKYACDVTYKLTGYIVMYTIQNLYFTYKYYIKEASFTEKLEMTFRGGRKASFYISKL